MSRSSTTDEGSLMRAILIILLVLIALPLVMAVVMMPMMGGWGVGHMNGWMWNGTGSSLGWIVMWFVMLAILVGAGYVVYSALRSSGGGSDPALEELRRAYARGELTDEEYEKRRKRLEKD